MKPEIIFGLESSAWPALLVDTNGVVLLANPAAVNVFGSGLSGDAPLLSAIWPAENGVTAVDFFSRWEQSQTPVADLKFRVANGQTVSCTVSICTFAKDGQKWFVLQLLPVAPPTAAPVESPAEKEKTAADSGLALKQKLDCALQLARTMSLDFNNALTRDRRASCRERVCLYV